MAFVTRPKALLRGDDPTVNLTLQKGPWDALGREKRDLVRVERSELLRRLKCILCGNVWNAQFYCISLQWNAQFAFLVVSHGHVTSFVLVHLRLHSGSNIGRCAAVVLTIQSRIGPQH